MFKRVRNMLFAGISVLAALACAPNGLAQLPRPNVNVLPAYPNGKASPPFPPPPISLTDAERGDGYLQRQVEPVIAASTLNPDHLLAAFNDYRTVSIPNDTGLPEEGSASGWIGVSRSYDRGRTWSGWMVPCFPQDTAALCASSPLTGMTSGSDPTLATTPGGHFYLGAIFYTPGGISNVTVVHYRDIPDTDGGDTIRYQGIKVVHKGGVPDDDLDDTDEADSGTFIDKPVIAADIARGTESPSTCGPVFLAYTIFKGSTNSVPFTSTLAFNRSPQGTCGSLWNHVRHLNHKYKQNQGAAIGVDPTTGKIYVVWRHVFQRGGDGFPDAILMAMSSDGGVTFSYPKPITPPNYAPFDQPGLATTSFPNNPAFRSNSFPSIAVDGNGNVYVVDQEKTFPAGGGYAAGYYEPRVVIRTSTDGGRTWTTGSIVDPGTPSTYAQQFMPVLSIAANLMKVTWYDFREQNQASDNIAGGFYVTGFYRQVKTYVAQSSLSGHDGNGNPLFSPSVAVTQYLTDVNTGQIPTVGNAGRDPAVNWVNLPMYNSGTNAFIGDFMGQMTAAPFVPNPGGATFFRWAAKATDFIAMSSYTIWTDARDAVFPVLPAGGGITPIINDNAGWQTYAPPGTGVSCINAGSRNANAYFSELRPGVIAASPATSRQLVDASGQPMERAFPIYIENPNSDTAAQMAGQAPPGLFFRVSFNSLGSPVSGSFAQGTELTNPTLSVDLEILQYSSAALTLYVFCPSCNSLLPFAPFEVTVQQITGQGGQVLAPGLQTAIFFDSDPTAPFVINANLGSTETHNASVAGPVFSNPSNPTYNNPTYNNPTYNNPTYNNAAPSDFKSPVGDFVWQATDVGNNASAYTALVNIAQTQVKGFDYELIVSRAYNFPGFDQQCNSQPIPTGSVISIIPNPTYNNPTYNNPTYNNPTYNNPTYNNASFAAVPPPSGSNGAATALTAASTAGASVGDGTTKMPLGTDHVYFVLRVYRADHTTMPLSPTEQANLIANASLLVFPQAPNTGTGTPVVQPPAPASSSKAFTTTALSSLPNASVFGQTVSFTATLTPTSGSGTPTGFVDFKDGSTLLQTVTVSEGQAVLQVSTLVAGTHAITAVYSGDSNFVGSVSNAVNQTVNKATTVTMLTSNADTVFGQTITFTVMVLPQYTSVPTGSVTLLDGGIPIASNLALKGGIATFATSALSTGIHTITAIYGGDANFNGSNSTALTQTVIAANTATVLTSSSVSISYLQSVRFTAMVSVVAPGAGSPSGSINFLEGESNIGSAPLIGGVATFTTSTLSVGTHTVIAAYNGDPFFFGSTSNSISQQVNAAVTNSNDSGAGSLRQAILDVNAQSGPPLSIVFNIPVSGVQTIAPQTDLPTLMQPAILDATTQPGYAGTPIVELNGSAGTAVNGLHVSAGGSKVLGFAINRFSGDGIVLDITGGNTIQGNYVGTDVTGTVVQANHGNGIHIIATPDNQIVGNVISGNGGEGVRIDGTLAAGNLLQANLIGTDASGAAAVGNSASGIYIRYASGNSVIGNTVSGNRGFAGVTICGNATFCGGGDITGIDKGNNASGNVVQGNLIGTNSTGTAVLSNQQAGVSIDGAPNTHVGGTTAGTRNIISFNGTNDVQIFSAGANLNKIAGNAIQGNTTATTVGISVGILGSTPTLTGNTLSQNSISGHRGLGIDLAPPGVNPLGGANTFPVITLAQLDGSGNTAINGTLNSTANSTFTVEFFSNLVCNASGNGEGRNFLGATAVTTDGTGLASFTFSATGLVTGNFVTTTATDASGTTSEFSACATVSSLIAQTSLAMNLRAASVLTFRAESEFERDARCRCQGLGGCIANRVLDDPAFHVFGSTAVVGARICTPQV